METFPKWQQDLVLERIEQARLNPETMLDWDEVSKFLAPNHVKKKSDAKNLKKRHLKFLKLPKSE